MDGVQPTPQELLEKAARTASAWEAAAKKFTTDLDLAKANAARSFEGIPDPARRSLLAKEAVTRVEVDAHRAIFTDKEHHARRRELLELERAVDEAASGIADDTAMLDVSTLSSARRATYAANLQGSGPAGLARAAADAIARHDTDLAAAIAMRLQTMAVKERPVSIKDLARATLPTAVLETREKLRLAHLNIGKAIKHTWAFQKPAGHERIKHGLRYGAPPEREAE